jgi:hypothetical protein
MARNRLEPGPEPARARRPEQARLERASSQWEGATAAGSHALGDVTGTK